MISSAFDFIIHFIMDPVILCVEALCLGAVFMGLASILMIKLAPHLKKCGHVRELYRIYQMLELFCILNLFYGLLGLCSNFMPESFPLFHFRYGVFWLYTEKTFWIFLGIGFIWMLGMRGKLIRKKQQWRMVQKFGRSCSVVSDPEILNSYYEIGKKLGVRRMPILQTSEGWMDACIYGIRQPVILIPFECYNKKEQYVAMHHELAHQKHHHLLFRYITDVLGIIYWFLPVQEGLSMEVRELQETICDLEVCQELDGMLSAKEYYETVIQLALRKRSIPVSAILANLIEGYCELSRRLENANDVKSGKRNYSLLAGAYLVLLILFLGVSVYSIKPHATKDILSSAPFSYEFEGQTGYMNPFSGNYIK